MCIASEEKRVEDNNNRQGCYIHGSANSVGNRNWRGGERKRRIKKCAAAVKEEKEEDPLGNQVIGQEQQRAPAQHYKRTRGSSKLNKYFWNLLILLLLLLLVNDINDRVSSLWQSGKVEGQQHCSRLQGKSHKSWENFDKRLRTEEHRAK